MDRSGTIMERKDDRSGTIMNNRRDTGGSYRGTIIQRQGAEP